MKRIYLHLLGYIILITGVIIILNLTGCGGSGGSKVKPVPTKSATPLSTPTPGMTATPGPTATPAPTFTPTPIPNLVMNPGFETEGFWNYVDSFNDFANAYQGFYSLKYTLGTGYCTQNIDMGFTPGEIIRARCWMKGDTPGNIFNLVLQFFKPGGGANGVQSINAIVSKTYTKVERTGITIPANTAYITVLISGSGGGFGIVDNVYVGP